MDILELIGRNRNYFIEDVRGSEEYLSASVSSSSFLVIGGAGSIGRAVVKELFSRNPKKLHVVDISENNLAELVRDIRSSCGYIDGDFQTFALDAGSDIYDAFIKNDGRYDYVANLSALKHVRSEKDPYTLMRMIDVNIINTDKTIAQTVKNSGKKYFCVSTDKAANPANLMGATKRIMELFLMRRSNEMNISTARFANVAFSDGSLLHSFRQRIIKRQPIAAPNDVRRYFVTEKEAGQLCLMSMMLGENRDIFFPKLNENEHLVTFAEIAQRFLAAQGFEPYICETEDKARELVKTLPEKGMYPCYFTGSDTTGEKPYEEFYTTGEKLDMKRFADIGIVKSGLSYTDEELDEFISVVNRLKKSGSWGKDDLLDEIAKLVKNLEHVETGKYLDGKM